MNDDLCDVSDKVSNESDDINLDGTWIYVGEGEKRVRLIIDARKKSKIRTKDIVGAIANEAGIPGKTLGEIAIFDEYTFVDVPNEFVRDILHGMKHAKIKGKRVHIEIAKKEKTYGKKRK
mgnify:CR=1 FL=1